MGSLRFRVSRSGAHLRYLPGMLVSLAVVLCAAAGCTSRPAGERQVRRAFYHWRGMFRPTPAELGTIRTLGVERLYLRLFDVVLDPSTVRPHPVGTVSMAAPVPSDLEIVPTIFITNDVIAGLDSTGVRELADNIVAKIVQLQPSLRGAPPVREIQIDCDWTTSTRDRYFALLGVLRQRAEGHRWSVSATIRLHQIRDRPSTGVPPVERGMLMVYNTGNPTDPDQANAIFDTVTIRAYTRGLADYPLELDVALPLFSWGVAFHAGAFRVLLNNLRREDLDRTVADSLGEGWYRMRRDTYIGGERLFAGDRIRLEEVDVHECRAVARMISDDLAGSHVTVAFFHLDPAILGHYEPEDLSALYDALR